MRERHYRTYQATVAAFGGHPLDGRRYWTLKRRGAGWAEVLGESHVADRLQDAFLERFVARIEDPGSLRLDCLFPGVQAALAALRQRGDRLVLLSLRRSAGAFHQQVEGLGIAGAFERACAGDGHGPGHLGKIGLIRQAGLSLPAAVVGDTETDVLAARQLGLAAIGVSSGLRNRGYLGRAGADVVLERIGQLPPALAPLRAGHGPG